MGRRASVKVNENIDDAPILIPVNPVYGRVLEVTVSADTLTVTPADQGKLIILTNPTGCKIIVPDVPINTFTSQVMFINDTSGYCRFVDSNDVEINGAYGNSFSAKGVGITLFMRGSGHILVGDTA